jgi:GNAT superfamily N-acetyltransferase
MNALDGIPACGGRPAWRTRPYREALSLRDGRQVTLRPMHHSDAPQLRRHFLCGLSDHSRLLRFHGVVNHFPDNTLRALTTQAAGRVALTAVATTDDGLPRLLAEARYVVDGARVAEFAVSVADAWQRQGLGRALLQRLAVHARSTGIGLLHGSVVPDNAAMLGLAFGLGAEVEGHAGEVMVRLPLDGA